MGFKKKDNENENKYIWRICKLKDDGKIDCSWEELGEIINKELFGDNIDLYRTSSAYRKPYQYAKLFYEDVFNDFSGDNYIRELQDAKEELKKERIKLNTINYERNKNIRKESRIELFYENIKESFKKIEPPEFLIYNDGNINSKEYILTIADVHAGANFESENNKYSMDICHNRFSLLLNETIKFINDKNINHINILELADNVQGILRISDLKLNESSVVESVIFIAQELSIFLNELSKYVDIDYYHVPTSNHTQLRNLGTKAGELSSEDVEYIISHYIKDILCDNKNIKVHLNDHKEYIEFNIYDYEIIAMHGHQIKNIKDCLKDLSLRNKKFYDLVFLAHFHAGREQTVGESISADSEILICPSFVGSDPYSDSLMVGAKSSCKIFGIDEYNGHNETYKIILN